MDNIISFKTWAELGAAIQGMTPEQQAQPPRIWAGETAMDGLDELRITTEELWSNPEYPEHGVFAKSGEPDEDEFDLVFPVGTVYLSFSESHDQPEH